VRSLFNRPSVVGWRAVRSVFKHLGTFDHLRHLPLNPSRGRSAEDVPAILGSRDYDMYPFDKCPSRCCNRLQKIRKDAPGRGGLWGDHLLYVHIISVSPSRATPCPVIQLIVGPPMHSRRLKDEVLPAKGIEDVVKILGNFNWNHLYHCLYHSMICRLGCQFRRIWSYNYT
jgi:hypothetical protein